MGDRYCSKCGVQTATAEQEFELGTAMGVSQEARIEELNSLSECHVCREKGIYESVRREMDEEQGIYTCREGFFEGEDCPICEHEDGQHDLNVMDSNGYPVAYVDKEWAGEYPCPYCENPSFTSQQARDWLRPYLGEPND